MKKAVPAEFLVGIDTIIFDMDGVITSEQNYWNAAALTVYEMFASDRFFGTRKVNVRLSSQEISDIRKIVFVEDKLISLLKDRGVNTNWDLAYVVICAMLLLTAELQEGEVGSSNENVVSKLICKVLGCIEEEGDKIIQFAAYGDIYNFFLETKHKGFELYDFLTQKLSALSGLSTEYFLRNGRLWNICQDVFQEWYLGGKAYFNTYGKDSGEPEKPGLMYSEQPVIPLEALIEVITTLYKSGIRLGVGTGRPFIEIDEPLTAWNLKQYFDPNAYVTYTEVMSAEKELEAYLDGTSLAKPHPYVFLKAIYGKDYDDQALISGQYDKTKIEKCLVVGDAGSDIMAAKAIECKFAAVLTGVSGKRAEAYFRDMNAEYILDDITSFIQK